MSQYDFGTIDPFVVDGSDLAGMLNNWRDALYALHRGPTRPDYAVPGLMWISDVGGPTNWVVNIYLGPSVGDRPILQINATTGAIANVADQITAALLSAQAAASPAFMWNATGNAANQKLWKAVLLPSGVLEFQALTDAGAVQNVIDFNRDGTVRVVAPGPTDNSSLVPTTAWVKANVSVGGVATPTYDATSAFLSDGGTVGSHPMLITQGQQVFSRSFTAVDASHPIEVDVTLWFGANLANTGTGALFIDGATAAVAEGSSTVNNGWINSPVRIYWQGVLAGGPHTFSVRFGGNGSGTIYLNGSNTGAMGGGAMRSTMSICEIGVGAVGPQGPPGPTGGPVTAPTYDTTNAKVSEPTFFPGAGTDTTMQITNGSQVFSRSFTAVDATHPIEVDVTLYPGAGGANLWVNAGLFIDGVAGAVAQGITFVGAQAVVPLRLYWQGVLPGGPHTFMVRWGAASGSYLIGNDTTRFGGGAIRNSMVIREIGTGPKGPTGDKGVPGDNNVMLALFYKEMTFRGSLAGTYSGSQPTLPTIAGGAALDSITFTPKSATSVLDIEVVSKGNASSTDDYVIAMFNGNVFVDQEIQYLIAGGNLAHTIRLQSMMPSPGVAPVTLNFRVGSNSGNAWRPGQVNNTSITQDNPYLHSWIKVRESTFG